MNKILLTLTILSVGAGGFLTARQATLQLHNQVVSAREAWYTQTQLIAVARSEQVALSGHVHELKEKLMRVPVVSENPL